MENGYRRMSQHGDVPSRFKQNMDVAADSWHRPTKLAAMFAEMKQHPEVQFSIKLRLGWDSPTVAQQLLPLINEAPLMQVALHPRIGTQGYKGMTDVEAFCCLCS